MWASPSAEESADWNTAVSGSWEQDMKEPAVGTSFPKKEAQSSSGSISLHYMQPALEYTRSTRCSFMMATFQNTLWTCHIKGLHCVNETGRLSSHLVGSVSCEQTHPSKCHTFFLWVDAMYSHTLDSHCHTLHGHCHTLDGHCHTSDGQSQFKWPLPHFRWPLSHFRWPLLHFLPSTAN